MQVIEELPKPSDSVIETKDDIIEKSSLLEPVIAHTEGDFIFTTSKNSLNLICYK